MRWTMRWTMAVCAVAVLTACAPGGDQAATGEAAGSAGVADGDPLAAAAATITPEDYRARLEVIAHDSMRGRFTPSPELEEVAAWIRDRFESFGLEAFEQRYELSEFARSPIVDAEGNPVTAPNTVGILRGSDPELADEYVVFSAHMDHVGVGRPDASGDSIYNGADDDGSGTTAIVELAEAFASLPTPPRRSLIFVTVSGEERGLWGSAWFASHMPVPAEAVVADLNIDMIGRNWPDTIVAIGRQQSELGPILEEVNAAHPELGMTAIDD
ncbi:MAG: M28 family peptidase, partial [Gemmatimonadetes bacterium]